MNGLKQWIRCMAGRHELVVLEAPDGRVYEFCLFCGERF